MPLISYNVAYFEKQKEKLWDDSLLDGTVMRYNTCFATSSNQIENEDYNFVGSVIVNSR
jgi:hypothetical protein